MDEEQKQKERLEKIAKFNEECEHIGHFVFGAQQLFNDKMKGMYVLISTILCTDCGHLFFDTQDTLASNVTVVNPNKKSN